MKRQLAFASLFAALLLGLSMLVSDADAEPVKYSAPAETTKFQPGTNVVKAVAYCTMCHSVDYISTQPPLPRATWKALVVKMQKVHGAPIPDAEIEPIVNYLVTTYGTEKPGATKAKP